MRSILLPPLFLAVSLGTSMAADCLSLPEAILTAMDYDPRIEAAQANRDIARANTLATAARGKPQVSVFGRLGDSDNPQVLSAQQDQFGVQATQELYSFGARKMATQAAKANAVAAAHDVEDTRLDIAQGAALAFLDFQRAERLLEIAKDKEASLTKEAQAAQSRLSKQVITLTDASQVQARLSVARSERINAHVAVEAARVRLEILTGMAVACVDKSSTETFIGKDANWLLSMPIDQAVDEAYARSSSIRKVRAQVDSAQASVGEASRAGMPVISGFAIQFYTHNDDTLTALGQDEFEDETRVGLNLNQQLYTGGRNAARKADAHARLKRARSEERLERIILEDLVKRALVQARAQQQAGLELLEASTQAKLQLDNTLTEYQRSTKTLTDLSLAYEGYYNTLRDETEARFQFYSSLIRAYAAIGSLTDGLSR